MEQPNISGAVPETFRSAPEPSLPPEVRAALDGVPDLTDDEPVEEPAFPERLDFGNGLFATLRHPSDLDAGDIMVAARGIEHRSQFEFAEGLIPAVVQVWNLSDRNGKPLPPPSVDPESLKKIRPAQYMKLVQAMQPYLEVLFRDPPAA